MSQTLQSYMAEAIPKALEEFIKAYEELPEDKRDWTPGGGARTSLDMVVECAMLNDMSEILLTKTFPDRWTDMDGYLKMKSDLKAKDWPTLKQMLRESADKGIEALKVLPDGDLDAMISMPWGETSIADTVVYPFWNLKYHTGQIYYIKTILGIAK